MGDKKVRESKKKANSASKEKQEKKKLKKQQSSYAASQISTSTKRVLNRKKVTKRHTKNKRKANHR
jgi:hypothetical protein